MITLLHGEDIVKSRTELLRLKSLNKDKEFRMLDGKTITDTDLVQALSSSSLFDSSSYVILEHLFSSLGKKIKRIDALIAILKQSEDGNDIIIWEDKKLTPALLAKFGKTAHIIEYSYPTILFSFLDNFSPQQIVESLKQYQALTLHEPPEVIQILLLRRIRQLMVLKSGKTVSELQSWQISRLTNQNRFFTMDELLRMYHSLVSLELSVKTGTTYLSLQEGTERLMAEIYYEHK